MFSLKRTAGLVCLAFLPAMFCAFNAGPASAANETISIRTSVVPAHGKKIYKHRRVPARMKLAVQVNTPPSSPKANPLKRAVIQFPRDLTFNPNNRRTPVCSDRALSDGSNLAAGTAAIVAACPKSVVGTGTAKIYLAKVNTPSALVSDPQLVIFNGGKNRKGAKLKIYAYSETTHVGILMHGTLSRKGTINVAVPVLASDSATASFVLAIPGNGIKVDGKKVRGLDPRYARIRCSRGKWVTRGKFTLGERAYPSGAPTGPSTTVKAKAYQARCHGARG